MRRRIRSEYERKKWSRKYYRKNKHSILAQQRKYREENRKGILARRRQLYQYKIKNKDEIIEKQARAKVKDDKERSDIRHMLEEWDNLYQK